MSSFWVLFHSRKPKKKKKSRIQWPHVRPEAPKTTAEAHAKLAKLGDRGGLPSCPSLSRPSERQGTSGLPTSTLFLIRSDSEVKWVMKSQP